MFYKQELVYKIIELNKIILMDWLGIEHWSFKIE